MPLPLPCIGTQGPRRREETAPIEHRWQVGRSPPSTNQPKITRADATHLIPHVAALTVSPGLSPTVRANRFTGHQRRRRAALYFRLSQPRITLTEHRESSASSGASQNLSIRRSGKRCVLTKEGTGPIQSIRPHVHTPRTHTVFSLEDTDLNIFTQPTRVSPSYNMPYASTPQVQMAELKHGRLAMLGVVGCLVQEVVTGKGPVEQLFKGNVREGRWRGRGGRRRKEKRGGRETDRKSVGVGKRIFSFTEPSCYRWKQGHELLVMRQKYKRCVRLGSLVRSVSAVVAAIFSLSRPLLRAVCLGATHRSADYVLDHHVTVTSCRCRVVPRVVRHNARRRLDRSPPAEQL